MITEKKKRLLYVIVDYLSTLVAVIVFSFVRYFWVDKLHNVSSLGSFFSSQGVVHTLLLFPLFMLLVYYLSGYYVKVSNKSRVEEFMSTLISVPLGTICFFMVVLLNDVLPKRTSNYGIIIILFAILFFFVYISRYTLTTILINRSRRNNIGANLMYIGNAAGLSEFIQNKNLGFNKRLSDKSVIFDEDEDISSIQIKEILKNNIDDVVLNNISGFYLALPRVENETWLRILGELYLFDKPIYVSSDDYRLLTSRVVYKDILDEPLMDISRTDQTDMVVSLKRAFDVLFSALGLILASPLIASFAIAVKISSKGPAFYSQERIGIHRKPFRLYKIRSMVADAESAGPALSSDNDERVTPVGRFMRKYRIDELPNLWNVLKGDMSLVGPRPEREFFLEKIRESAPYCVLLHQVRPGLTSLGMVKYGYASNIEEMIERLKYDLIYIQNISPSFDIKILFYTVRAVVRGEGK